MEAIAIKSKAFRKLIFIYVCVGILAVAVFAVLLILKKTDLWTYLVPAAGGASFLAALVLFLLDRRLPSCYLVREGDKLKFENGFECRLCEVSRVFSRKSSLYVVVGENPFCYRFVSDSAAACKRLSALVEESKKENPQYGGSAEV